MEQLYDNWRERLEEVQLREHEICSIEDDDLRAGFWDEYIRLIIEEDELIKKLQKVKRK